MSPNVDWFGRYSGASGSLENGAAGKITHSWSPCWRARRPTSPEPSVVITSQAPLMNWSVMMSRSSKVCSTMSMPAASAASAMFFSVVVPAVAQTVAPATSATVESRVKPSLARAMSCWPS